MTRNAYWLLTVTVTLMSSTVPATTTAGIGRWRRKTLNAAKIPVPQARMPIVSRNMEVSAERMPSTSRSFTKIAAERCSAWSRSARSMSDETMPAITPSRYRPPTSAATM